MKALLVSTPADVSVLQGSGLPALPDVLPDSRLPGSKLPVCGDEDRGGRHASAARRLLSRSELCHAEVRRTSG